MVMTLLRKRFLKNLNQKCYVDTEGSEEEDKGEDKEAVYAHPIHAF